MPWHVTDAACSVLCALRVLFSTDYRTNPSVVRPACRARDPSCDSDGLCVCCWDIVPGWATRVARSRADNAAAVPARTGRCRRDRCSI